MSSNVHAGVGAGKGRKPFRIREFLDGEGTNMAQVARKVGVSRQVVQATVRGQRNNRKVLGHLKAMGCPLTFLSLPEDMLEAAN